MTRRKIALAGVLAFATATAQASLFDRGGGLIYDDMLNVTWLQDARYAYTSGDSPDGKMTWEGAMNWAANLTYLDSVRGVEYSDWRLPFGNQCWNQACGREFTFLFYTDLGGSPYTSIYGPHNGNFDLFRNIQTSSWYWTNTEAIQQPELYAVNFSFADGTQSAHSKDFRYYAWAVRDGDVASVMSSVPEPTPLALASIGILGLGFSRRKNRPS